MSLVPPPGGTCEHCGAQLDAGGEAECAVCGFVQSTALESPTPRRLIDQRWAVGILLFGVMGVLGLPVLWMSRGFSTSAKIWLSILVTIYTALLAAMATVSFLHAWRQFQQLMG